MNKGVCSSLCGIDFYSKYEWVVPLKDKKGITIITAFQKVLNKSVCKSHQRWKDKGSEFYNRLMKSWLQDNDIEMYSTIKEENYVVAIVIEYKKAYHRTIIMKPVDVKSSTYIDISVEYNEEDPKFQVRDHSRISKYKSIFANGYTANLSEEVVEIKNIQNTVPWTKKTY